MKYIKSAICILAAATALGSCDSYDFEQEMYEKSISLLQNTDRVYEKQVADLQNLDADGTATFYVVAQLSGSQKADRDYTVQLEHSDTLFNAYNKSNYDIDSTKFAKLLPTDCYEEPSLTGVIKAGEEQVKIPIKVKNFEKLSPDTTYFLEYSLVEGGEKYIQDRNRVLLRIHWKNNWGSTLNAVDYSYTSAQVITPATTAGGTPSVLRPTNTLRAFPLSANEVRFMAGSETYDNYATALDVINSSSVIYRIGAQRPENPDAYDVEILPYKSDEIEVIMQTPEGEYDNTYLLNKVQSVNGGNATYYKEFRVHYKYRLLKATENSDGTFSPGPLKEVKAKLRYNYNPRSELL